MTTDHSALQVNQPQSTTEKSKSFKSGVNYFLIGGVVGIIASLIHFTGIITSGFSSISLADGLINLFFGVLSFSCSRILARGKFWVIWLFGGGILISILYSFIMGRGFNYIFAIVGAIVLWFLFSLKKNGEIS